MIEDRRLIGGIVDNYAKHDHWVAIIMIKNR